MIPKTETATVYGIRTNSTTSYNKSNVDLQLKHKTKFQTQQF